MMMLGFAGWIGLCVCARCRSHTHARTRTHMDACMHARTHWVCMPTPLARTHTKYALAAHPSRGEAPCAPVLEALSCGAWSCAPGLCWQGRLGLERRRLSISAQVSRSCRSPLLHLWRPASQ